MPPTPPPPPHYGSHRIHSRIYYIYIYVCIYACIIILCTHTSSAHNHRAFRKPSLTHARRSVSYSRRSRSRRRRRRSRSAVYCDSGREPLKDHIKARDPPLSPHGEPVSAFGAPTSSPASLSECARTDD